VSQLKEFTELYLKHEKKIKDEQILKKASKSILYSNNWEKRNIKIENITNLNDLQKIPYTSADDLRKAWVDQNIEDIIITKKVGIWHCTSGSMGVKKWIPWSYNDYITGRKEAAEIFFQMGMTTNDIMMSIVLPAPFISGSLGYRLLEGSGILGKPIEEIILSPNFVKDSFGLLLKRQPTIMLCTPSLALRMAEEITRNTPKVIERLSKEKRSMKLKIASFVTKIKSIKPKQIFKNLKAGYFTAEPLDPYRKALEEQFNIETFDIYGFTEGFGVGFECKEHNGLHFPSHNVILEIIPVKELNKEVEDPTYHPEAVLLSHAEKGLRGELVATDFKEALPLVRYRLRDMVQVIDDQECACGFPTPKLKVLGRTDDIINLGVIRLSTIVIDKILRDKYENGEIKEWEIYITREGYKPKLKLMVEPLYIKNEEEFKKEIFTKINLIEVFKQGLDNELFIFNQIEFVSKLKLEIIGQGKSRRIRYSPDYMKSVKT
jgi:phenylacetate-CoA ligase